MKEHYLKTWPQYWEAVENGQKQFEVRKNDRAFQKGDLVCLTWFNPEDPLDTRDNFLWRKIGFIVSGGQFGLKKGYCAFQLLLCPEKDMP